MTPPDILTFGSRSKSFVMSISGLFAAGRFREEGEEWVVRSPWDQREVGKTWLAGPEIVDECIMAAATALKVIAQTPLHIRAGWLEKIANGIHTERESLAGMISLESGKPLRYALGEVDRAEDTFRIAVQECLRPPGEYLRLDRTPAAEGKEGWVKYFPSGIVAGISPFNFPINLVAHKIAPALAAGCPIILKPSSSTPMTALMLAGIAAEAGLPAGALSVLPMRRKEGDMLVEDPRIAVLSFTGSPEVGWKMKARAGKKKVILELGGNAGVIVSESADLPLAVSKCLSGGFAYSGQVCIHTQRIFVHESLFEEFSSAMMEGVAKFRYGSPLEMDTDVSVMIDEDNAARVESWVAEAVQQGAKLLCGGKRKGAYMEPSLLTDTQCTMKVCALEVFGPVVVLEKFSEFDAAVKMLNDSRFGLQAGIFTKNIAEMDKAFRDIEVGGVILNDAPTFRVDHMPYGGVKDSGLGREGVRYAMMEMLEPRILVKPL